MTSTSDVLTLGVLGLRNIGMNHIRKASQLSGVRVLAGADVDKGRLLQAKAEFGLEECYADARELIARSSVDAVVVALPNHLHAPVSIRAMEAGKHVLVEKPIARSSLEAQSMIKARDRTGMVLMVGMNQRFSPGRPALKKLIASGELGEIYYARARWRRRRPGDGLWQRGEWFLSRDLAGGGPLLDLALYLMGYPKVISVDGTCFHGLGRQVAARMGKRYKLEDMAVGLIRCQGNKTIFLEASYFGNEHDRETLGVTLYGSQGGARDADVFRLHGDEPVPLILEELPGVARSSVEHFCNVLQGRERLCPTAEQGVVCMRIIEALYESAKAGKQVRL